MPSAAPFEEGRENHCLPQDFGKKQGLETLTDEAGNILMRKPATHGMENCKTVALQAHMDMVCEKNNDVHHDFLTDPIETIVDGEWMKAKGTTLGADNGIGVATALAVLADESLVHGPLECLFTVDEETGLTGAFALKEGLLHADILLNLDSEDEGELFIGCAGGVDSVGEFSYQEVDVPDGYFYARVQVKGLLGGHSGSDIHMGRANANKLLARFLNCIRKKYDIYLCGIDGGNLRNAIAREAWAVVCVPMSYKETLRVELNHFAAEVENELALTDKGVTLSLETEEMPKTVFTKAFAGRVLQALYACPHGVFAMSRTMPGLVETSTNMASVKMEGEYLVVNTSQRSSIESSKYDIMNKVEAVFLLAGAEVSHGDGYPGWQPNVNSALLKVAQKTFVKVAGKEPKVRAIHAGLECGLFLKKYPHLDMISIGPSMTGVHSPNEQLSISSTGRCWEWLKAILAEL